MIRFRERVFEADIFVLVCPFKDLARRVARRLGEAAPQFEATLAKTIEHAYREHDTEYVEWIVWIPPDVHPSSVWHEAFHVTAKVLRRYKVPLTRDTEEVYAYYQCAVARFMLDQLPRKR
jgi:hypothetical protein